MTPPAVRGLPGDRVRPHDIRHRHRRNNTMKRIIEIRPAEGGADARLFVSDLAKAYQKLFDRLG